MGLSPLLRELGAPGLEASRLQCERGASLCFGAFIPPYIDQFAYGHTCKMLQCLKPSWPKPRSEAHATSPWLGGLEPGRYTTAQLECRGSRSRLEMVEASSHVAEFRQKPFRMACPGECCVEQSQSPSIASRLRQTCCPHAVLSWRRCMGHHGAPFILPNEPNSVSLHAKHPRVTVAESGQLPGIMH